MKRLLNNFALISLVVTNFFCNQCPQALASTLEGQIRILGSSFNTFVSLRPKNDEKGIRLCEGKLATTLKKLVNLTASVEGEMKSDQTPACFLATEYKITKMPSGREPIIGVLEKAGEQFKFVDQKGKTMVIQSPAPALQKMLGHKMVIDGLMEATVKGQVSIKVVSFMSHP